jgi:UPF0755 protein
MKRLVVVVVLIIIIAISISAWWKNGLEPVNSKDYTAKIFVVKPGDGVREIAYNLKKEGLIKDPIVFFLQTKRMGLDKQIQAGDFRLNPSMNATEIATNLTHGTLDIWVTIQEGLRAEEIADIFKNKLPSYEEDWRENLVANEGYLFPDTYLIPKDADSDSVIELMRNNFQAKYDSVKETKTTNLTDTQTLIVASLIEREAAKNQDRALVASVIFNRLSIGMKLDIDATLQYMLGYQEDTNKWWKSSLTANDKLINSPYNTYRTNGLPPTAISNPGLASLKAALNPAETDYLFYFTDKNGVTHFSKDLDQHEANISKFGL